MASAFKTIKNPAPGIRRITLRKKFEAQLGNPHGWTQLDKGNSHSGVDWVGIYETANPPKRLKLIVRKVHFPDIIGGSEQKDLTKRMGLIISKRIPFEEPMAHYEDEHGAHFYVSKFEEGPSLFELGREPNSREAWLGGLRKAARLLRKMHDAGIAHGHPHPSNIIYNRKSGRITFIDPKFMAWPASRQAKEEDLTGQSGLLRKELLQKSPLTPKQLEKVLAAYRVTPEEHREFQEWAKETIKRISRKNGKK